MTFHTNLMRLLPIISFNIVLIISIVVLYYKKIVLGPTLKINSFTENKLIANHATERRSTWLSKCKLVRPTEINIHSTNANNY
jgi:hypothetical protein